MSKLTFDDRKKLEEIATDLIGIKPIKDREYQKLLYETITTEKSKHRHVQIRKNFFKSTRRRL
jgi:hypothetical protein